MKNQTKLAKHRIKKGMSQTTLAKSVGILPSAVCHMESKGIRNLRIARIYAKILQCEPIELLDL